MKTTIKTLVTIFTLGFIGILNTNATENYAKTSHSVAIEVEKNVKSGLNKANGNLMLSTEQNAILESDVRFDDSESVQPLLNEDQGCRNRFSRKKPN